jgi:hypothetical protein
MSPDVTQLLGGPGRPQRQIQILLGRVSGNKPAPESFTDRLYVVIPSFSIDHYWVIEPENWPACHGGTLPQRNAECLLIRDDGGGALFQERLWCVGWTGVYTPPVDID